MEDFNAGKKKWLKYGAIALAVVVILSAAAGIPLYSKYQRALEAYEAGDYESAEDMLEGYPFGGALYVKTCCKLGEQYLNAGDYEAAYSVLDGVAENKYAYKAAAECAESGDFNMALNCISLVNKEERTAQLSRLGKMLQDQGKQEQAELFLKEPGLLYPYCQALDELDDVLFFDDPFFGLEEAREFLKESGNYRDAQEFVRILDSICEGSLSEAAEVAAGIQKDAASSHTVLARFCVAIMNICSAEDHDLEFAQSLSLYHALRSLEEPVAYDRAAFEEILGSGESAIGELPGNEGEFYALSWQNIHDACGNDPAGKILIVKECAVFDRDDPACAVSYELMDCLPEEYLPKNADEVSYVITITYGFWEAGAYDSGIPGLQEWAIVTAYSPELDEEVYMSEIVFGKEPPSSYRDAGMRDDYMSGGRPDITEQFLDTLETVMAMA